MTLFVLTPRGLREARAHLLAGPSSPFELGPDRAAPIETDHDLEPLSARISSLGEMDRPVLDTTFAADLHRRLPIPRRLATNPDLWRWLAMGPLAPFLQRRWPVAEEPSEARIARWLGPIRAHGLARLWWAAELTRAPHLGYLDTQRLVRSQRLLDRVLASGVGRNRTVLLGLLDALKDETDFARIDRAVRTLGIWASTVSLEALERTEVAALVRRAIDERR